jgi:hypothetical protein
MVQHLGDQFYGSRCIHCTFDYRKVLGFSLDGLHEQSDQISGRSVRNRRR